MGRGEGKGREGDRRVREERREEYSIRYNIICIII